MSSRTECINSLPINDVGSHWNPYGKKWNGIPYIKQVNSREPKVLNVNGNHKTSDRKYETIFITSE
jgi:hypothetical protein